MVVQQVSQKDHQMDITDNDTKCPDQNEDISDSALHQQSQGDDHSRESSQNETKDVDDDSKWII